MNREIYVATYTDSSDYGFQKVFDKRADASNWLKKKHSDSEWPLKEWGEYGAWTCKIKKFTI